MPSAESIYLDNHATTRCDPRVVAAMLPFFDHCYANAHSIAHEPGRRAAAAYDDAINAIASGLHCDASELITTSGATEANNLAIIGSCCHPRQKRRHLITATTEHPSVLDPIARLEQEGFSVTRLPVHPNGHAEAGRIDMAAFALAISDATALVSVMLANNEIGVLQDMGRIAQLTHQHGALLHTDATQAVGKIPIDLSTLDVDLLTASAHKFYGPKGVGLLYLRQKGRRVRLRPLNLGGGQQQGLRSGTLNVAGVVGMATALQLCCNEMPLEQKRQRELLRHFFKELQTRVPGVAINGPPLEDELRLSNNINVCFPHVEGDSLMSANPHLAISSGAACSTMEPGPSHVLLALGLSESAARRSIRIGVSRFTTREELASAATSLAAAHQSLSAIIRSTD
jgi:cysteine desulfurase